MPARVLLTGFEPFGAHAVNPSEVLVRRLAAAPPAGVRLETAVLPVAWNRAFPPLRDALVGGKFDAVLLLGLAATRDHLEFERFALNWRASSSPDEDGVADEGSPIDPAGPAACFSTLPLDDLVAACVGAGAPARTSNHAGTFLCNQVLYQTLRLCARRDLRCLAGFLHLPPFRAAPGGANETPEADRGIPEDLQARAVAAALVKLAETTAARNGAKRASPRRPRAPSRSRRTPPKRATSGQKSRRRR